MMPHFSKLPTSPSPHRQEAPPSLLPPALTLLSRPLKGTWGDLRYYIGIEIISCLCYLLQRMATVGMSEWANYLEF